MLRFFEKPADSLRDAMLEPLKRLATGRADRKRIIHPRTVHRVFTKFGVGLLFPAPEVQFTKRFECHEFRLRKIMSRGFDRPDEVTCMDDDRFVTEWLCVCRDNRFISPADVLFLEISGCWQVTHYIDIKRTSHTSSSPPSTKAPHISPDAPPKCLRVHHLKNQIKSRSTPAAISIFGARNTTVRSHTK